MKTQPFWKTKSVQRGFIFPFPFFRLYFRIFSQSIVSYLYSYPRLDPTHAVRWVQSRVGTALTSRPSGRRPLGHCAWKYSFDHQWAVKNGCYNLCGRWLITTAPITAGLVWTITLLFIIECIILMLFPSLFRCLELLFPKICTVVNNSVYFFSFQWFFLQRYCSTCRTWWITYRIIHGPFARIYNRFCYRS